MDALDVSRWQFGITTVYHFILVPLTIGLAPMVAIMQTVWVVTGNEAWLRATKFFGKLFLINFALGVATGIVQEFQFGMNWSEYSRFVGDVFGGPLALEGLVAFFLESTFLGLWIFGWDRLPKKVHLLTIWMVAIGVNASAWFIVAANSWMQHPVGAQWNEEKQRPELKSLWDVMTNSTTLAAFPHTIAGAFLTASTFVAGIGCWWMVRNMRRANKLRDAVPTGSAGGPEIAVADDLAPSMHGKTADQLERDARTLYRPVTRLALWIMIISGIALAISGDQQAKLMFKQQPMKMASAESLCTTETGVGFSVLAIGTQNNCEAVTHLIEIPNLLSFLADNDFNSTLQGVEELQAEHVANFGPGNYKPNLFVTYWAFRAMMGWAIGSGALALLALWLMRRGRIPDSKKFGTFAIWMIPTPFLANSSGWIFTEMGRQPWMVAPNPESLGAGGGLENIQLTVQEGVSRHSGYLVLTSLIIFTLLYGALGLIWFTLIRKYTREGPAAAVPGAADSGLSGGDGPDGPHTPEDGTTHEEKSDEPKHLSFAY
ncbi:cytochrome bd-I ubiquinol oxidase subunit 1 apoprotein [Williamsia limnetica]|uniref:Cytochrome bd-I ubiquinol oxidase subunit 1 apoprotein n=1 Tax=Williamsia limnetica TaxID=882452 RepID=A0A318RL61_WILLI|nr:cytochrome ubiquinol oxidase subunit I [Williamsia limnetica]PYE14974.1 cytochrome bd-I ubiquinol oxidase subunit 1 apoprotein [Williamsia limnetica]